MSPRDMRENDLWMQFGQKYIHKANQLITFKLHRIIKIIEELPSPTPDLVSQFELLRQDFINFFIEKINDENKWKELLTRGNAIHNKINELFQSISTPKSFGQHSIFSSHTRVNKVRNIISPIFHYDIAAESEHVAILKIYHCLNIETKQGVAVFLPRESRVEGYLLFSYLNQGISGDVKFGFLCSQKKWLALPLLDDAMKQRLRLELDAYGINRERDHELNLKYRNKILDLKAIMRKNNDDFFKEITEQLYEYCRDHHHTRYQFNKIKFLTVDAITQFQTILEKFHEAIERDDEFAEGRMRAIYDCFKSKNDTFDTGEIKQFVLEKLLKVINSIDFYANAAYNHYAYQHSSFEHQVMNKVS